MSLNICFGLLLLVVHVGQFAGVVLSQFRGIMQRVQIVAGKTY